MTRPRTAQRRILPHGSRIVLIAVLVSLFFGASSTTAFALWTASGSAGSTSVTAGKITSSMGSSQALAAAFVPKTLTSTGAETFTNTGTVQASYAVTTTVASGNALLAKAIAVTAWPVAAAANCTASSAPATGAVTGTWGAFPAVTGSLAPAASAIWCFRSSVFTSAPAKSQVTPTLTLTLSAGTWRATSTANVSFTTGVMIPVLGCTNAAGNFYVQIAWDVSPWPAGTYYGIVVNGTLIGSPLQSTSGVYLIIAGQISPTIGPDGVVHLAIGILDADKTLTQNTAAATTATVSTGQSGRLIKCGG